MSDSFADLWNSSAPPSNKPAAPQKLGSAPSIKSTNSLGNTQRRPQYDAFSMLSTPGSSNPSSRPITPSSKPVAVSAPKPASAASGGGDAFSSLLTGSLSSGSNANLTIAERAALAQKQKTEQLLRSQEKARVQAAAWSGLDSLGASGSSSARASPAPVADDWFGGGTSSATGSTAKSNGKHAVKTPAVIVDDDWGLGDFGSTPSKPAQAPSPAPPASRSQSKSGSLWDLDELAAPSSSNSQPQSQSRSKPAPAPKDDFDFDAFERSRDDGLLSHDNETNGFGDDGEDDILGDLSKPVDALPKKPSPAPTPAERAPSNSPSPRPQPRSRNGAQRSASPPPHIIGQIVEMGFSPAQARSALSRTEGGVDVSAALEMLLGSGSGSNSPAPAQREERSDSEERPRANRRTSNRDAPPQAREQRQQKDERQQLQDQADKLLAQASTIGAGLFNKGLGLWAQGKEKAQKMYEERAAAAAAGGSGRGTPDGRPAWMRDIPAEEVDEEGSGKGKGRDEGGFADDPDAPPPKSQPPAKTKASPTQAQGPPKTADLFSDSPSSAAYISPFRRGKPKANPPASSSSAPSRPKAAPTRPPSPLKQRQTVPASQGAISTSNAHKTGGTEKYKLGQFGDAEGLYTRAIDALPSGHLLLVPLLNNRALTRLKNGNPAGAIEDCTSVISLIGPTYVPSREEPVTSLEHGAGVDLGDGLVKAMKRRAEAWEGREKWEDGRKDWEALAGTGWANSGARGEAVRGVGRCRRMADAASSGGGEEKPKPKPAAPKRPPPRPAPASQMPSAALDSLRKQTNAAEAEDNLRHELKDTVDARLAAWKGGKENNIRALIASLDMVLWPELGWATVGMSELIMEKQVKIKYTRAIGKVHPDKLNANNTTLEQRMIANGVFGTLSDAWNAFKQ